jgi:hypothetical protein
MYNIHISLSPFSLTIIYKEKYKECLYDFEEVLKVVYNFLKGEKKEKVFLSTLGENLKERLYG